MQKYGEVQVITVPSDSNPTLTLNGIAAGTFALEVEEYKDGTLVDSATFMGVPSTANTVASLSFTDGTLASAGNLAIDYDGDGAVDVELPAGGDVMYEDFVAEEEDVPETPASQSQSGGRRRERPDRRHRSNGDFNFHEHAGNNDNGDGNIVSGKCDDICICAGSGAEGHCSQNSSSGCC